jgi:osmotically inducible protein OsmC
MKALARALRAPTRSNSRQTGKTTQPPKESAMNPIVELLHTAKARTRGGRERGVSRSSDGLLDIRLSMPGTARIGANPEQLLAAAWSASLASAIALAARQRTIAFPVDPAIEAEVDFCVADGAYFLRARLNVSLPGVEQELAEMLLNEAEKICPYSNATRGNIEVTMELVRTAL